MGGWVAAPCRREHLIVADGGWVEDAACSCAAIAALVVAPLMSIGKQILSSSPSFARGDGAVYGAAVTCARMKRRGVVLMAKLSRTLSVVALLMRTVVLAALKESGCEARAWLFTSPDSRNRRSSRVNAV